MTYITLCEKNERSGGVLGGGGRGRRTGVAVPCGNGNGKREGKKQGRKRRGGVQGRKTTSYVHTYMNGMGVGGGYPSLLLLLLLPPPLLLLSALILEGLGVQN